MSHTPTTRRPLDIYRPYSIHTGGWWAKDAKVPVANLFPVSLGHSTTATLVLIWLSARIHGGAHTQFRINDLHNRHDGTRILMRLRKGIKGGPNWKSVQMATELEYVWVQIVIVHARASKTHWNGTSRDMNEDAVIPRMDGAGVPFQSVTRRGRKVSKGSTRVGKSNKFFTVGLGILYRLLRCVVKGWMSRSLKPMLISCWSHPSLDKYQRK